MSSLYFCLYDNPFKLVNAGDLKGALLIWEEYQINGAYAGELKKEIRDSITYYKREIKENSTDDGGID